MNKALVNMLVCDNAEACGGPKVCPTKAMTYDSARRMVTVDYDKCTGCGLCAKECPAGAILIVPEEDYLKTKGMIDDSVPSHTDLYAPKYNTEPMTQVLNTTGKDFDREVIQYSQDRIIFADFYDLDKVTCRANAIDYHRMGLIPQVTVKGRIYKTSVRRIDAQQEKELAERVGIEAPGVAVYWKGRQVGKLEGEFSAEESNLFLKGINRILEKI